MTDVKPLTPKHRRWKKDAPKAKNPAAQQMGRLGGAKNTPAQIAARLKNARLAGRPRRVCTTCGQPCYGGHKSIHLNKTCDGHAWEWQTPSEKRAAKAATKKPA